MPAFENTPMPPGASIRRYTVLDCVATDPQGFLYRANSGDDERTVLLHEFLPVGLATRHAQGVQARPGKADAFAKAQAAYTTRLRAAALVGHPALPTLEDIGQDGGTVYAVSPWRDGRPLTVELASRHAVPELRTVQGWARSLCDALAALHQNDIVHGRLSPAMIRVLDSGELMLPLVGSGHHVDEAPAWVAPEQHPLNPKPVGLGTWTDVYQLSALMHLLLAGTAPPTVLRRWEGAPLERLAALVGRVPEGLLVATRQGLAMHASVRPQTTTAWLAIAGLPDRRERSRYDLDDPAPPRPPEPVPPAEPGEDDPIAAAAAVADTPTSRSEPLAGQTEPAPIHGVPNGAMPSPMEIPATRGTEGGHQPMPASVEERLDRVERSRRRDTPAWVWMSAVLAIVALGAIVWLS